MKEEQKKIRKENVDILLIVVAVGILFGIGILIFSQRGGNRVTLNTESFLEMEQSLSKIAVLNKELKGKKYQELSKLEYEIQDKIGYLEYKS